MKSSLSPVFTTPTVIETKQTTFHKFEEEVTIKVPGNLVKELISICDGTKSVEEIADLLHGNWEKDYILAFFEELYKNHLVADKLQVVKSSWKAVENPTPFPSSITDEEISELVKKARKRHRNDPPEMKYPVEKTDFHDLLNQRKSVRTFSGEPVTLQSIVNMLWAGYGETKTASKEHGRKTVPSAGALYPSSVHIVLFQDTGEIKAGVYKVYLGSAEEVGFKLISEDTEAVVRSFVDPLTPENSHGVIVVSGSFQANGEKYGNRSLLYSTLEAGHIAQNIHTAAHESEVATVEIGGFYERILSESLKLPDDYRPLTTIVFGEEAVDKSDEEDPYTESHWQTPFIDEFQLSYNIMLARINDGTDRSWSSGKATSPRLAKAKALAEAREWAAYGNAPEGLRQARIDKLDNAVHPHQIFKFHEKQLEIVNFPFQPFHEEDRYAWTEVVNILHDTKACVLADHVYTHHPSDGKRCAVVNSSGVAAHPQRIQAIKNGALELIERDAFMNAYLGKLRLPTIAHESLPDNLQARINHIEEQGFRVWVKDFSLDLAPVVFIFAQSEDLTFTTCASCSDFNSEGAVNHALIEVEQSVLNRLAHEEVEVIEPSKVESVHDHGKLYDHDNYFQKADFLARGGDKMALENIGANAAHSWEELLNQLRDRNQQLFIAPLHLEKDLGGNQGLYIIRSIIPSLVPISFGYMQEPRGMERIKITARRFGNKSISYRDMPEFPHPFV